MQVLYFLKVPCRSLSFWTSCIWPWISVWTIMMCTRLKQFLTNIWLFLECLRKTAISNYKFMYITLISLKVVIETKFIHCVGNCILFLARHAAEICNMALELKAACGSVVRPDIAPRTITIQAGIHTGYKIFCVFMQFLSKS